MNAIEILTAENKLRQIYGELSSPLCRKYLLSQTGLDIIMFISENPEYNTARDVCRYRGIKSGIASVAIDNLIGMGYLERQTDLCDRRIQRLVLTEKALPIASEGREIQQRFEDSVFSVMSASERESFKKAFSLLIERLDELQPAEKRSANKA